MTAERWADWCEDSGNLAICGTATKEASRRPLGDRWCFSCRKRHNFDWVVMVPDGMSYYDPHVKIQGVGSRCTDLFPGWSREWGED